MELLSRKRAACMTFPQWLLISELTKTFDLTATKSMSRFAAGAPAVKPGKAMSRDSQVVGATAEVTAHLKNSGLAFPIKFNSREILFVLTVEFASTLLRRIISR
ncbi:hypothetical protein [Paraburkholderia caribensis]|uniref:hypothetical protein n=1 Tax=Paraburkholderia caribensis TaxID=75105 RepID=UPI001CB62C1F|nr:hypothetical protein PCAR4_570155 [Paraburkholderia caribensis]